MYLPNDLEPLPEYGWTERPEKVKLEVEEVRTALWLGGSVASAARLLRTRYRRVERFVGMSPYLHAEWREMRELLIDRAEHNVHEAVNDPELRRAFPMSQFVLVKLGKDRGWGAAQDGRVPEPPNAPLQIAWGDEPEPEPS